MEDKYCPLKGLSKKACLQIACMWNENPGVVIIDWKKLQPGQVSKMDLGEGSARTRRKEMTIRPRGRKEGWRSY